MRKVFAAANMHRSFLELRTFLLILPALLGERVTTAIPGGPHGNDNERGSPASGFAGGGVGQAERPRSAESLHPRLRGAGEDRRARLSRGRQNEGRAGIGTLQG